MKRLRHPHAFTLAETMIAMAASIIVVAALFTGSIALQRSCASADRYVTDQSDQRLLLDYLARDFRRAVALATNTASAGPVRVGTGTVAIESSTDLIITLPAYYKNDAPSAADYDQSLPIIASGDRVAYGTTGGPAPGIDVTYRKLFVATEGCVCFVRVEAAAQEIVMRQADDLHLQFTVAPDGKSCALEGWFTSTFGRDRPRITAHDCVMLRNLRVD